MCMKWLQPCVKSTVINWFVWITTVYVKILMWKSFIRRSLRYGKFNFHSILQIDLFVYLLQDIVKALEENLKSHLRNP